MALNIKNEETCELARELADLTDDTMTGAITVALRERLEQVMRERDREDFIRDMEAIAERCAKLIGPGFKSTDHGELLYYEHGAPK